VPTFERFPRFRREFQNLTVDQQRAVLRMLHLFIAGLRLGSFDSRLRLKRVQAHPGIWEISWAADGRATFEYGPEVLPGETDIIWRRIGAHDIFQEP
jgi:hypothetical protein